MKNVNGFMKSSPKATELAKAVINDVNKYTDAMGK
jgi:hypothetical protein